MCELTDVMVGGPDTTSEVTGEMVERGEHIALCSAD